MTKIARTTQKIFASGAANNGVFGSAQANGGPGTISNVLATIMGLPAWASGWLSATIGAAKFPCLEEIQAIDYVVTTQIAYLLQEGIPEYDVATTYYADSIVKKVGTYQLYGSVTNANIGNALTDPTNWLLLCDLSTIGSGGGVVADARNLSVVYASATTITATADEIITESALGGTTIKVISLNKTLNIATTGVNAMDTGAAPTNGTLYLYAIAGAGQTNAILGTTSGSGSSIYAGANMPAGYTNSALIGVYRTNGSAQFNTFKQLGREVFLTAPISIFSGNNTAYSTLTSQSISAAVPVAAKSCSGYMESQTPGSVNNQLVVASDGSGTGTQNGTKTQSTLVNFFATLNFRLLPIITSQTIFFMNGTGTTLGIAMSIESYTF